jgi:hypothetical protein
MLSVMQVHVPNRSSDTSPEDIDAVKRSKSAVLETCLENVNKISTVSQCSVALGSAAKNVLVVLGTVASGGTEAEQFRLEADVEYVDFSNANKEDKMGKLTAYGVTVPTRSGNVSELREKRSDVPSSRRILFRRQLRF